MKLKTDRPFFHERAKTTEIVGKFWDQTSVGWRTIWGPHIHHGYYENNESQTPLRAQEKLLEKLIEIVNLESRSKILDVGCGMGGSSLYLAKKHQADVAGITLSKKQVAIATQQAQLENIHSVSFQVEDALSLKSFSDNSFDIVWSLESCEQFYDKKLFIEQAFRVLKPGGKLMLATWCSDREEYAARSAKQYRKLCLAFDLPYMPTIKHYSALLERQNFKLKTVLDWSKQVEKSWEVGVSLANAYSFLQLLKLAGWRGLRFAKQIKLMRAAFQRQTVRYGVLVATKNSLSSIS